VTRIAVVSDSIYPYNKGGKETRIHELTKRLAAAGHDVHIYTMHWWDEPAHTREEDGVHLHAISPLYPLYSGERRSIRQGILFGLAAFKLIREKFDVVDVDHIPYFPLFSVKLVSWLKRRPMMATWHEVWGKQYWQTYLGATSGFAAYAVERLSVLMPKKIIAVSAMTSDRLGQEFGANGKTALVQNGINLDQIKQVMPSAAQFDVIYAGRLLKHKHVDLLLHAVAQLKQARPGITCQIIGDGPERKHLESLARKLGLQNTVQFLGFLPRHQDVMAHMKAGRVFVLPSTREGFGISFIEANACGLPVVTIDHPDNAARYLVTPVTGRLAKLTADSLAHQIDALLKTTPQTPALQTAAGQYDWETAARRLSLEYAS
jgi:L-malate glycosyltransferase